MLSHLGVEFEEIKFTAAANYLSCCFYFGKVVLRSQRPDCQNPAHSHAIRMVGTLHGSIESQGGFAGWMTADGQTAVTIVVNDMMSESSIEPTWRYADPTTGQNRKTFLDFGRMLENEISVARSSTYLISFAIMT